MIGINVSLASMVYADGKLYIIGGMENRKASNELYSIDMTEFNKTRKYTE
jgi:hypothetical protein